MKNEESKILKMLQDHEKRITFLEGKKAEILFSKTNAWYKPGSTIDKVVSLLHSGFFKKPLAINAIISEFKAKDYHLSASDLTLPLRKIVRKGLLKRTKINTDGSRSKQWLYMKA
jgi:hypothetical protein